MAIAISSSTTSKPADTAPAVTDTSKAAEPKLSSTAVASKAQANLNAAIVQSSIDVSIGAGNDSLTLMLKTAINGINDALKPEFGENAIQNAASQDNSPEATAGRIVSLSTGFFQAYKDQHKGVDDETNLKNFMDTIRGGFEKGYGEAKNILDGLKALNGDVAAGIQKTYDLVQKGYADFESTVLKPKQTDESKAAAA